MAYTCTYIVECRTPAVHPTEREAYNGDVMHEPTYYVGGTNNPRQRISDHLAGKGAKYLKGKEILRVAYTTVVDQLPEYYVKSWTRAHKRNVLEHVFSPSWNPVDFWKPFWRRCAGCNGTKTELDKPTIPCGSCHGTGGVFIQEKEGQP